MIFENCCDAIQNPPMIWMAVLSLYGVMSLITAGFYALDKRRATRNAWRIPERTLHTLELLGGWPGALVAQSLFRHKRHKSSFMLVFYGIVTLHALIWIAVAWLMLRG